jgi:hypothetical protein
MDPSMASSTVSGNMCEVAKRGAKTLSVNPKVRENRIRAKAERYGLRLTRSRQRDGPLVGTYGLVNDATENWAFAGDHPLGYGKSLDEVEAFLLAEPTARKLA